MNQFRVLDRFHASSPADIGKGEHGMRGGSRISHPSYVFDFSVMGIGAMNHLWFQASTGPPEKAPNDSSFNFVELRSSVPAKARFNEYELFSVEK